ncbi:GH92 family glycosyl hydrolase [Reichenbachiella sp.]
MNRRLIIGILIFTGLFQSAEAQQKKKDKSPYDYVNPFIGTGGDGHTYPGATVPFGMVQPSPDTGIKDLTVDRGAAYHWCAGYRYEDTSIAGFSHTHFSGTGHADLGDILVMPTVGPVNFNRGTAENPDEGYRSRFDHENESAAPGYYQVRLQDYGVNVELTATNRVALHKYTFPESQDAHVLLDLTTSMHDYPGKVIWSQLRVENETTVTGFRQTRGWGATRYVYFAIEFSKPIKNYGLLDEDKEVKYTGFGYRGQHVENYPEKFGKLLKANFDFETKDNEEILMKVAISGVSTEGAMKNLKTEIPHWDFEKVRNEAKSAWENELDQIVIEGSDRDKEIFYTSTYHTMLAPVTYMDVDNKYRGIDQNIYTAEGFTNYTIFSLWDTYRALHPLFTIIQPERTVDMIQSMLVHQEQSVHGLLPVWSFHANETWCMIGYHAVPVIADAYAKGIRGFDEGRALNAMAASATNPQYGGLNYYMDKGYIPFDKHRGSSVSKTLEYAYDDWTISKMAELVGENQTVDTFRERAGYYQNIFDTSVGFTRGKKDDGTWRQDFNPITPSTLGGGDFTEGNAWQYSWYVPHDMNGVINLLGGEENFTAKLDSVFEVQLDKSKFDHVEDMVGLIGQYAHGNEPSHHIAYLYNYGGKPWKTQERIHQIMNNLVDNTPDGLAGNDDCGQMSAWYVFSSLGFYPVCPGSNEYVFGSPSVQAAVINLSDGSAFEIKAKNLSKKNIYIQGVKLNGKPYNKSYLRHEDLMKGGTLEYQMGSKPNKSWASAIENRPFSMSALDN